MAKCPLCNSRKGKRKCLATQDLVCSMCCGDFRNAEKCGGCPFFKDERLSRSYSKAPYFSLPEMADNQRLQACADVIESAIGQFDLAHHHNIADKQVSRLLELLLDKYFFGDSTFEFADELEAEGFGLIDQAILDDLGVLDNHEVSKVIGTIYRSIRRRTEGGREYLKFIAPFVGVRGE